MKKKLLFSAFLFLSSFMSAQTNGNEADGYVIQGIISGNYKADRVYLVRSASQGIQILDSAKVENNRYIFRGTRPVYAQVCYIQSALRESQSPQCEFFLEEGNIVIRHDAEFFANSKLDGTPNNILLDYTKFLQQNLIDSMRYEFKLQRNIYGDQDEETELKALKQRSEHMRIREFQIIKNLTLKYMDQAFAAYQINRIKYAISLEELKTLRSHLSPGLKAHPYTREIDQFIETADFGTGSRMPDFELPDQNGKIIHLQDFKGKYVLIDFWASWCGPCLKEMPHMVELYTKYKGKKFEILGISLDNKKEAWIAAIKKQKMKWPQLCDFKAWHNEPAKTCGIKAIPQTFLIDPEGKVIAAGLRGEKLEAKIKEVLNRK